MMLINIIYGGLFYHRSYLLAIGRDAVMLPAGVCKYIFQISQAHALFLVLASSPYASSVTFPGHLQTALIFFLLPGGSPGTLDSLVRRGIPRDKRKFLNK